MKSEPDVYGIDDLARDRRTEWEGVRNYVARNHLKAMKRGDRALFYHTGAEPAVVGEMKVAREAYPDPSQFDPRSAYHDPGSKHDAPRWYRVDVSFVRRFVRTLTREEMKRTPALTRMPVLRWPRLSVTPVTAAEWKVIVARCRG